MRIVLELQRTVAWIDTKWVCLGVANDNDEEISKTNVGLCNEGAEDSQTTCDVEEVEEMRDGGDGAK
jgi:hypothetical protein